MEEEKYKAQPDEFSIQINNDGVIITGYCVGYDEETEEGQLIMTHDAALKLVDALEEEIVKRKAKTQ